MMENSPVLLKCGGQSSEALPAPISTHTVLLTCTVHYCSQGHVQWTAAAFFCCKLYWWRSKIVTAWFCNCKLTFFVPWAVISIFFKFILCHLWLFFSNLLIQVAFGACSLFLAETFRFNVFKLNIFHWKMPLSLNINLPQIYAFLDELLQESNLTLKCFV